ncbi:MAG: alpha/beta hydrolase [Chitinophagaceae bacterium]
MGNDPVRELMPLMADFKKLDSINAPVVELATADGITAMKYVRSHSKELSIDPGKIGFMGFSAGGTLTMSVMLSAPIELKPNFIAPIYLYGTAVIGKQMPQNQTPMFIAVASDDQLKFVPHSIDLYNKWISANHPVELHIYEKGGHGFGMRKQNTSSDHWTIDFENWLRMRKFL